MSDDPVRGQPTETATFAPDGRLRVGFELPRRWWLERPLGTGGQADVWLAFDQELAQLVAMKVFRPELSVESRERLRREVRIGRQLQHPNLVRIFELVEADGRMALAMEWMPGGSLGLRLAREGPLQIAEVEAIAEAALSALGCLHEHGLVHRDVKPGNLLLDGNGMVRLADLGLVKAVEDGDRLTRTAATVGSPGYMSPEQIRGQELTPASDLYSLGVTLFELLDGKRPFEGNSEFDEARGQVERPAPSPRRARADCPRWLARFILRLLEKRPGDRFRDAGHAASAFRRRRGLASPRAWRRFAGAAVLTLIVATALWVLGPRLRRQLVRTATASVDVQGALLRGLDARGREAWRFMFRHSVRQVERVDLFGEGEPVTIGVAFPNSNGRPLHPEPSDVMVVGDGGRLRERVSPELLPGQRADGSWDHVDPTARVLDLLGDGHRQLALLCSGRVGYTSSVVLYWPLQREWRPVLWHSGFIFGVDVLPDSNRPGLLIMALNNKLCTLRTMGAIRVQVGAPADRGAQLPQRSPELGPNGSARASWEWYVLLEEQDGAPISGSPRRLPDGGFACDVQGGTEVKLDGFGNPETSANAGRDLRSARLAFVRAIEELRTRVPVTGPAAVRRRAAAIEAEFTLLLAERPYAQVLAATTAEALDDAGDREGARETLRAAALAAPCEDLLVRMAQLEALSGGFAESRRLASEVLTTPTTPNGWYRAPRLLVGIAVATRDETLLQRLLGAWVNTGGIEGEGAARALQARARLFWDRPLASDASVTSWVLCPEGDAVAALARWRLGAVRRDDPEAMQELAAVYPDVAVPCLVARAAALLGLGRAAEAVAALDVDLSALGDDLVDGYMNFEFRELGAAIRVKAMAAAGRADQARAEALRLRTTMRPGLLPARMVSEVLVPFGGN